MNIVDLSGKTWQFKHATTGKHHPATVPGCIHSDLLAANLIPDPYYRDNEKDLFWIGKNDWHFFRSFDVPAALLKNDRVRLRCEGLDTVATVTLNGKTIGETANMFRSYEFDVKELLKPKDNQIEVFFKSPINECNDLLKKRRPGLDPHIYEQPRMNKNMLRKEQCNFGWDWGPTCVTSGIWRPIRIVAFNTARISDLAINQKNLTGTSASLDVTVNLEKTTTGAVTVDLEVMFGHQTVAHKRVRVSGTAKTVPLRIADPQRWWPAGMGRQPLYTVKATLSTTDGEVLDGTSRRIGLRTLKLVRKRDKVGESFGFEANGVPFFAKGANWIPAETFLNWVTPDTYRGLLQSAVTANMNMLRVWGGGIYENDTFYDLCDELGICIWQDFMFACAPYPSYAPDFMKNVAVEAEQNVKRLRHHASLALWCGNNELEADRQCVTHDGRNRSMLWKDYYPLFDVLLKETVETYCPSVAYWPSSPHTPLGDREHAGDQTCGDAHLWSAVHDDRLYRTNAPRFVSEVGFIGFPEPKTVNEYTISSDRNIASRVMEHHQRGGNASTMMSGMLKWFAMPDGFDNTLWLSQLQQGMSIQHAVEHWRRSMPHCMGALYWQLNDCWQVASWASIDYRGRWKALHYMARKFFAPLLISGVEDGKTSTVELHVTSDKQDAIAGTYRWRLTRANGRTVCKGQEDIRIAANGTANVTTLNFAEETERFGNPDLLLWLELVVDRKVVSRNFVSLTRPKHLELPQPDIKADVTRKSTGRFTVKLKSAKPALWVWLELAKTDVVFDDNWICLEPGKTIAINVETKASMTLDQFKKQLRVRSLYDTYQ